MSRAAQATGFRPPSRWQAAWFGVRVWAHVLRRGVRNLLDPGLRRHRPVPAPGWLDAPVLGESRSPLWQDGAPEEFMLLAGKVENLRRALPAFQGLLLPAGEILSFWRQLGPPWRWRGFVPGREIREGCVVPTVAGGLCQLSNALARAARQAGLEFIERHGHSARIAAEELGPTPALERDDATVFWNYVDLRLRAPFDCRLELELSAEALIVRIRARASPGAEAGPAPRAQPPRTVLLRPELPVARGCLSCGEQQCFRHARGPRPAPAASRRLVLMNAPSPEFHQCLSAQADWAPVPRWQPWQGRARRTRSGQGEPSCIGSLPWSLRVHLLTQGLWRSLRLQLQLRRLWLGAVPPRQALLQQADEALARCYARRLRPEQVELMLDQSLLLPLDEGGALAGRRYQVWLHSLPLLDLQARLDQAAQRWPQDPSLRDFRLPPERAERELRALRGASALWTSHAEVARLLRERHGLAVQLQAWQSVLEAGTGRLAGPDRPKPGIGPGPRPRLEGPPRLALAASSLGRKGAWELAQVLRELAWPLRVLGSPPSEPALWAGLQIDYRRPERADAMDDLDAVLLPAYVEHAPRLLLRAHRLGLPLIVSPACGLPKGMAWAELEAGDVEGLRRALQALQAALNPA